MAERNHTVRERGQFGAKIKVDKDALTLCTHKSGRKPDAPTEEGGSRSKFRYIVIEKSSVTLKKEQECITHVKRRTEPEKRYRFREDFHAVLSAGGDSIGP